MMGAGKVLGFIGKGLQAASDLVFASSPLVGLGLDVGSAFFRWAGNRQGSGEQGAPMPLSAKDVQHQREQAQAAAHAAPAQVDRGPQAQRGGG